MKAVFVHNNQKGPGFRRGSGKEAGARGAGALAVTESRPGPR